MTTLEELADGHTVAVSRLAHPDTRRRLVRSARRLVEVPHVTCEPVGSRVPPDALRIRSWPNIGGRLETGSPDDVVVWHRALAPPPLSGTIIGIGAGSPDIEDRTHLLVQVLAHLEQLKGVARACTPEAPTSIVYTPGVDPEVLDRFRTRRPGVVALVPRHLVEFPGGVRITVTPEASTDARSLEDDLAALLSS